MDLPFGKKDKFDYSVEVMESRNGIIQVWETQARIKRDQISNVPSFDVKGIPRLIPVPDYTHIFLGKKGEKKIKIFSNDPESWEIVYFDTKNKSFAPKTEKYSREWLTMKIETSHERWKPKDDISRWLPLVMFFLTAIVFVAGLKFATDSFDKSAEAGASATASFSGLAEKWEKVTDSCQKVIETSNVLLRRYEETLPKPKV